MTLPSCRPPNPRRRLAPRGRSTALLFGMSSSRSKSRCMKIFSVRAIAEHLKQQPGITVRSVRLDDAGQGLPDSLLDNCDVLVWWGHIRNREVKPENGKRVVDRIKAGKLSLIALHSAHWSEPFVQAMENGRSRSALGACRPSNAAKSR